MTARGRLERNALEGGGWVLVTGKERYVLIGDVPAGLAGRDVIVDGELDEGFGIFMQGPQLRVRTVRTA